VEKKKMTKSKIDSPASGKDRPSTHLSGVHSATQQEGPCSHPRRTLPEKKGRSHSVIVKVENLWKSFRLGQKKITVLKDIDLNFYSGEFAIIYGPSGCGKSTLLHSILGLEQPDRGKVYLRGKSLYHLSDDACALYRREKIGMVYQQSNWIKSLNVWENIAYPLYLQAYSCKRAKKKAIELLGLVGVSHTADQVPTELSGGEQQKAALARALIVNPGIIIADEPTGNLDSQSGKDLMYLLTKLNRKRRKAIIMVTHDSVFLPLANRRVSMKDGQIVGDEHD